MRLGIGSYTYTWRIGLPGSPRQSLVSSLDFLLEEAARLGVGVIQVADNLPIAQLSPRELDDFERRVTALGLQVEVAMRGINPNHLRRYLALAARFRSPFLRSVIDSPGHKPNPEEVVEILQPLRLEFEEAGVTLAFENHDRFSARILADIVRKLGPEWTGIVLDMVNSFGALEGPVFVVETLAPNTVNLHLKDFTIFRADHTMSFTVEGRPVGQGLLDIPWLFGELRRWDRDVNAVLELWTPPEKRLEDTIAKERRWAEESITYLRTIIKG